MFFFSQGILVIQPDQMQVNPGGMLRRPAANHDLQQTTRLMIILPLIDYSSSLQSRINKSKCRHELSRVQSDLIKSIQEHL